mmetsp:Transcript_19374/g.29718  ORF Transcript_19374/g.29718 Transcript_19374/m.29718 type:complete len:245 (-) Transcript_19374:276-1010(-)
MPFKLSAFATKNEDATGFIDWMKIILVAYTCYCVALNFVALRTWNNMLKMQNLYDNATDITIIFLQTYTFMLKMQDANSFNIDPMLLLKDSMRRKYLSIYFFAVNFRDFTILETIGLIVILVKVVDGLRLMQRLNVIILALIQSTSLLSIFLALLLVFNFTMVPLAQAVWGTYLLGYKSISDAIVSVFTIAYSKGNLEVLLDLNFIWSLNFMVMYYVMAIFILHAAFHMVQTDALKNVVLLFSL